MKKLLLFLPAAVIASLISCHKDTECKATVKCLDSLSQPMPGALVQLYATVKSPDGKTTYTADVTAQGNTDGGGAVAFTFKLPAIYDVKATKTVGTKTLTGISIIKLEEGKTVEKTLTVK